MATKLVTVYSTKYALTSGISKEARVQISGGYAMRSSFAKPDYLHLKMGKDAFLTEDEAKIRAVQMAESRRESLHKEEEKLVRLIREWGLGV